MDMGPALLTAIIMSVIVWAITYFNADLGKSLAFVMTLPIIVPIIILYISAVISIQNASPADSAKALDTGINAILKFFESHILDVLIGDIAGVIVGAVVGLFTGSHR